ncbi:transglycosylase SLT domain-containing protein [Niveibacterium sp. 24ML]|uniref:transglycosylase SLT domain-containing protein n=1 Tax=Niveibacterium sp. 24ML TaxID=2985512 RepID=UPI00226FBD82|nr:transglycosylase SLT domain-containing protein [Niveibacterium sp. 24ML]MCX9157086.1 transglycosylase SLT domain-containing protein [Niveibacterium sp. 24ML]
MQSIARRAAALLCFAAAQALTTAGIAVADDAELSSTVRAAVDAPAASPAGTDISAVSNIDLSRLGTPSVATIDLTSESSDLWQRMRQGFAMRDLTMDLVTDRQIWYLARPGALRVMFERGRKYLFYIVEELEKRGMPTELALLPMVESAFNPMAYSSARASGLWQFIPSTGKDFNLDQNWWVDERRDVIASTNAALTYLQALYEMHGDWHLALASYNWGENAVARAVAKNRAAGLPTEFAYLSMPQETRYYVPKLQALKNIIASPQSFGFTLPPIPNEPYFVSVGPRGGMDLHAAAQLAEMPIKDFLELNPSFNRPVIPGQSDQHVILPKDKADTFISNLEQAEHPLLSWQTYTLQRNERVEQVAQRFGISPTKLREVNGLGPRMRPTAGYTLLVPSQQGLGTVESAPVLAPKLAFAATPKSPPPRLGKQPNSSKARKASTRKASATSSKQRPITSKRKRK